jgi:hypothetical protein
LFANSSDPYAVVEIHKEKFKTRTADDAGSECQWNQTFKFSLNAADKNQEFVHFKVKDENTFKDAKIGRADIKTLDLIKHLNQPQWIQLMDYEDFSRKTGKIQVLLTFQGTGLPAELHQAQAQALAHAQAPVQQHNLAQAQPIRSAVAQHSAPNFPPQQPQMIPLQGQNSLPPNYAAAPVISASQDPEAERLARLRAMIVQKHKISEFFANKLFKLEDFEIVLICDDSGSMNSKVVDPVNRFAPPKTRWDELKATVEIVTDIAGLMDDSGIDIYFLNRETLNNVTSTAQIQHSFSTKPAGTS